jgi:hypothetical protein
MSDYSPEAVDKHIAELRMEAAVERQRTEDMRRLANQYKVKFDECKSERERFRQACERWAEVCDSWEAAYKAVKASNLALIEASLSKQQSA